MFFYMTKVFTKTENGIAINDIDKALQIARDEKYYNTDFDISYSSLNEIYRKSEKHIFTALINFYLIGKLQGIKQGIAYEKGNILHDIQQGNGRVSGEHADI